MISPDITIVMPVCNEYAYIQRSLSAVLNQDYPNNCMEVIVADGMSNDGTREIVQELQKSNPNIILIDNPGRIVPTGLNAAIQLAKGDIIVRVDGHTEITPDYVTQCVLAFQRSLADNVGGRMNAVGQGAFGQAVAIATSSHFGVGGARFHYSDKEEWVDTVYMGAWPKEVFSKVGLFDEELVRDQDDEFNYRLRAHGGRILLSPHIKSCYTNRSTLRTLGRQYFQYGYWKVRVLQKHTRQMRPRQFVPPAFVAASLGFGLLAIFFPILRVLLFLLASAYLIANLAASLWTAARRGWRHLPLLPLVYAILHIGYGSGFLVGLIKFVNRWGDKKGLVPAWETEGNPAIGISEQNNQLPCCAITSLKNGTKGEGSSRIEL